MNQWVIIFLLSWMAGITAFIGGFIARLENSRETETKREVIHGVIAFGGGILISAVAFALAPKGIEVLSPFSLAVSFFAGGFLFCILDAYISRRGGNRAQFMAMLIDFVPEAITLGAVFGHNRRLGVLLAVFIGAQNLPEGFNSYREIAKAGGKAGTTLALLLAVSFLGPVAAFTGFLFLQDREALTAGIMVFAAGGILYLVFQDIAPQARMRRHWLPPLGAVSGFIAGMLGEQLIM